MGSLSWGAAAQRRAWGCKVPSDPTLLWLCDSVTSGRGWELFGHPSKRFVNRGPAVTSAAEPQFHSSNSQGSPKETQGTSGLAARSASRLNRSILPPPVIFRTFQLSQSRTPAALPTLTGAPPGAPHRGGTWRDGTWRTAGTGPPPAARARPSAPGAAADARRAPGTALFDVRPSTAQRLPARPRPLQPRTAGRGGPIRRGHNLRRPATPRCRYPRPLRSSPLRSPLTSLPHPGPPPPPSRRAAVTMAPPPALPRPPPRGPAPSAARWRAPRDAGAGPRMRKRFWAVLLLPGLRRGVWSGRLAPAIVSRPFAPLLRLRPVALSCTVLLLRSRGSGAGRAVKSGGRGLSVLWCPVRGAEGPWGALRSTGAAEEEVGGRRGRCIPRLGTCGGSVGVRAQL